jgi:hypothetical protein
MTWTIGGVVLPDAPSKVTMQYKAVTKVVKYPTNKEIIISLGRAADKMVIEGSIVDNSKTQAQLESNYLIPLRNLVYTEVSVDDGNAGRSIYDGTDGTSTWIVYSFNFWEDGGYTASFKYKMEFIRGGIHVVTS